MRIFLGDKKPSKENLRKAAADLERKAGKLKKPKWSYLSEYDAEALQDVKESYKAWDSRVSKGAKQKFEEDFLIRFTYNTNAIEGNKLTLRQTALILKDKLIPSGIRAQDYNEAINGKECMDYLKSYKSEINKPFLEKINRILTKNTETAYGGRIRFFDVKIQGSGHVPPSHKDVKRYVSNFIKWHKANKNALHPFELATLTHAKLAWIHPFEDGNGRTTRAVMNFILMRKKFPMFFIPYEKKESYYKSLQTYDKGNHKKYVSKMLSLVIDQIKNYKNHNQRKTSQNKKKKPTKTKNSLK